MDTLQKALFPDLSSFHKIQKKTLVLKSNFQLCRTGQLCETSNYVKITLPQIALLLFIFSCFQPLVASIGKDGGRYLEVMSKCLEVISRYLEDVRPSYLKVIPNSLEVMSRCLEVIPRYLEVTPRCLEILSRC